MTLAMDPEYVEALMQTLERMKDVTLPEPGDVMGLRALVDRSLRDSFAQLPDSPDVTTIDETVSDDARGTVRLRWYARPDAPAGPCVVYVHGGGMVCGSVEIYDRLVRYYVQQTGVSFAAVEFGRAPEVGGPDLALAVVAGLRHVRASAGARGIDPSRIALMGDSGGGGVAAGAAIIARDRGIPLTKQILVFPMLDDRTVVPDPELTTAATWSYAFNETCWRAVLKESFGADDVSPYAAPARLSEFRGLAPAYLEVGELDIFRDECIAYATALLRSGTSCELHVHPGAPHNYDWIAPSAMVTRRALTDRMRVLTDL